MEFTWQLILFIYIILAFALYGIFHWIEVVLDLPILEHEKSPGVTYENLRKIVHTIVQEVIKLPEFYNQKGFSSIDANQVQSSFEPKIYEDLLATAVINKIVETYNDKKYENSSGIHSGGSDLDSSCHIDHQTNHQNFILNSRCSSTELKSEYSSAFNERFRSPSMKTADIIDEIFREKLGKENYQSSASASARSELSDYIQNHKISLPDFEFNDNDLDIGDGDDDDEQDSDEIEQEFQSIYANSTIGVGTNFSEISDNWLFRKVGSSNCMNGGSASSIASASSPVGMLVPSPTQDCPARIGNRNADEISDLSENGSDIDSLPGEHSDNELNRRNSTSNPHDLPHVLVESKTLIGGKNEMNSFEQSKVSLINLLEPDSLVSEQSLNSQSPAISEAKNNLILIEDRSSPKPAKRMEKFTADSIEQTTYRFSEANSNADLLIKFDSLEAYNPDAENHERESNNVEIFNKNENRSFDSMHVFDQSMEDMNRFTGESSNANTLTTDTNPRVEKIGLLQRTKSELNEEYKDSLEMSVTDRGCVRNDDEIKGDQSEQDTVEQDSLETIVKFDANQTNDGTKQFFPFAQIGTNWSQDCAAQNSNECEFDSNTNQNVVENQSINTTNELQTNCTISTNQTVDNQSNDHDHDFRDLPGSIAEREHMKWRNAVELPNNPYSAEALQRRLSQTSTTKFMDIERLAGKFDANIESKPLTTPSQTEKPIKVVLGANRVNPKRYGRDYYINDSKSASGSRTLKSSGDLNRHRTIDDEDDDNITDNRDGFGSGNNTPDNDYDETHSLLVGDIEVVSTTESIARIQSGSTASPTKTTSLHTAQPIQVDESDPILDKATKLDHLCTKDRDYYLLQSEAVSAEEYAKLSLGSETTTDDSHVQQLSLPHCDDSISTTFSEESDCAVAIRVYDLNKRETKILRHDIIKKSRNPVGGETIHTAFDNLGNCCSETIVTTTATTTITSSSPTITINNAKDRSDSPLQTTIQQFNSRILENANEARKPPRSPTKLKSIHLNRNPRKLKMADVQLMNDAFGTSLDPKIIEELKQQRQNNGDEYQEIESSTVAVKLCDKELVTTTEQFLDVERESSKVCVESSETTQCQEFEKPQHHEQNEEQNEKQHEEYQQQSSEITYQELETKVTEEVEEKENEQHQQQQQQQQLEKPAAYAESTEDTLVKDSASASDYISGDVYTDAQNHNENNEIECAQAEHRETTEVPPPAKTDNNENNVAINDHPFDHISNDQSQNNVTTIFERNHEVIVQVNEHKEKSVIEEDVVSALPSVKALARTFATKNKPNKVPEKLERPKMVWRNSYNGSNNNDINVKDQNGNDSSTPPHFNHSYNPVAPGYSITARSLSTKFRAELKNATDESGGRLSPERPSSPVLVPGILKNNIAFFENLRKQ